MRKLKEEGREGKKGEEGSEFSSDELLHNIPRSETSLVTGPAGSGKSTEAANITVDWARSEVSRFDLVLFLSSLHKKVSLPLNKLVWGEFSNQIGETSQDIFQELQKMKEKILVIIDGLGNTVTIMYDEIQNIDF